jgi:hypothetical protein
MLGRCPGLDMHVLLVFFGVLLFYLLQHFKDFG